MRITEAFLKLVGYKAPPPLPEGTHRDNGHLLIAALVQRNRELAAEAEAERECVRHVLNTEPNNR